MRERVQDNEQEGEFFRKNKEFLGVSDAGNVRRQDFNGVYMACVVFSLFLFEIGTMLRFQLDPTHVIVEQSGNLVNRRFLSISMQ